MLRTKISLGGAVYGHDQTPRVEGRTPVQMLLGPSQHKYKYQHINSYRSIQEKQISEKEDDLTPRYFKIHNDGAAMNYFA